MSETLRHHFHELVSHFLNPGNLFVSFEELFLVLHDTPQLLCDLLQIFYRHHVIFDALHTPVGRIHLRPNLDSAPPFRISSLEKPAGFCPCRESLDH